VDGYSDKQHTKMLTIKIPAVPMYTVTCIVAQTLYAQCMYDGLLQYSLIEVMKT